MINNNLFKNKEEYEIAKLKFAIQKFKQYDEGRKAFYKEKMERLGVLESYVLELENGAMVETLKTKIENQSKELKRMQKLIQCYHIDVSQTDEDLKQRVSYETLKQNNKVLRKQIKTLRKSIDDLTNKLNKYEKQLCG